MEDLDYESHLARWKAMYGDAATGKNLAFIESQAKHDHALAVWNPLFQLSTHVTLELPDKLTDRDAKIYLRHGVGRRLQDMFGSYRNMTLLAYEGRTEPLDSDDQREFSRDLNSFYINLRGVLDNLAYCFWRERQPDLKLGRMDISLFSPKYRENLVAFGEIGALVKAHDAWNTDVKSRRDPVAHRIPLYLPPSIMTEAEVKRLNELMNRQMAETLAGRYEEAARLDAPISALGKFCPAFLHHPDQEVLPIYPTIPEDAGHVVAIGRAVCGALGRPNALSADNQEPLA